MRGTEVLMISTWLQFQGNGKTKTESKNLKHGGDWKGEKKSQGKKIKYLQQSKTTKQMCLLIRINIFLLQGCPLLTEDSWITKEITIIGSNPLGQRLSLLQVHMAHGTKGSSYCRHANTKQKQHQEEWQEAVRLHHWWQSHLQQRRLQHAPGSSHAFSHTRCCCTHRLGSPQVPSMSGKPWPASGFLKDL